MHYIPRFIERVVTKSSKTFKILYVGGPRQVGKTTMLTHLAKRKRFSYITLDDLNQRELAKKDPALFLGQLATPAIIDEVQYAPELFPEMKKIVDRSDATGQFWLTGSQQFHLMKHIQESLTGRVAIITLLGLSMAEKKKDRMAPIIPFDGIERFPKMRETFREIFEGSFPVFASENAPDHGLYYNSYIQTYLDRDLVGVFGVNKTSEFNRFIQLCAARTGQVLNTSDLARDSGISPTTAIEWLSILENTGQIYLLRPYYPNITKRIIKSPKLYFLDTGLASYLTKWTTPDALQHGAMAGAFFETYVVSEIIKSFLFRGIEPALYYLRDKEGHEVDMVIEHNGLHLVEIKVTASITNDVTRGMRYFSAKSGAFSSTSVVSMVERRIETPHKVIYVPYTVIN